MADTPTFITGVAEGAFENAFRGLPDWATEDTALKIEGLLNKILKIQTTALSQMTKTAAKKGTALNDDDLKKTNDEIVKMYRGMKRVNDDEPKRKRRDREIDENHKKEVNNWKKTTIFLGMLQTGIVKSGEAIKKTMFENVETFDQLYSSGINVMNGFENASSGFEALQQLTTLTGVRFTELSKTILKYNTAVNAFGLGKFAKTISATSTALTSLGFNSKETAELLGSYLESQKGFADVNSQTQDQVNKNLIRFGERVTRLSQATGMMRTELLKDIEAISQSVEANILAGQIGNDAAGSMIEFVASFKDKNLGQAFLKMMTDTIKPLNTTFMDFQKTGFGGFGQKLMNFTRSLEGLDPKEAARRTAEFAKANDAELKMMVQRGNLLSQAGVKEADGMLKVAVGLQQQGRNYKEISEAEQKKADETAKASKDLQNQWEKFMSQLQAAFAPTIPMLEKFAKLLTWANTAIDAISGAFSNSTKAWVGVTAIIAGTLLGFKLVNAGLNALAKKIFWTAETGGGGPGGGGRGGRGGRAGRGPRGGAGGIRGGAIKGSIGGIVAGVALDYASDKLEETGHHQAAAAADIASSAASLASMGALIGSVVPVIGTGIGAIVGGAAGAGLGLYKNWDRIGSSSSSIKEPTQSSINDGKTPEEAIASENSKPDIPGIDAVTTPSGTSTDINSVMAYQNKILVQILESAQSLVSVNKDILKYTKVHT